MSISFQSRTSNDRPVQKGPLDRLHGWLEKNQPAEYDKPTPQEIVVVVIGIILSPVVLIATAIWILFFNHDFRDERPRKRLQLFLVLPFLLPAAYVWVLLSEVLWPMAKRSWRRWKLMRHASREIREIMK